MDAVAARDGHRPSRPAWSATTRAPLDAGIIVAADESRPGLTFRRIAPHPDCRRLPYDVVPVPLLR